MEDLNLKIKVPPADQIVSEYKQLLVVLSGPSGVGKDAVINRLRMLDRPWHFVVTTTTRKKRPKESEGIDYNFVSNQEFWKMVNEGEFLEHAEVYGNLYGVPKKEVKNAIKSGKHAILKIDVQGAATIRDKIPNAVFIFMMPNSMNELAYRLKERSTENKADMEIRIRIAHGEVEYAKEFEYLVVNWDFQIDRTAECIDAIITAETCKVKPRIISI